MAIMTRFMNILIGGKTGKRESSWFMFLLWLAFALLVSIADMKNEGSLNLEFAKSLISQSFWIVIGWLGAAHGLEVMDARHRSEKSAEQGKATEVASG